MKSVAIILAAGKGSRMKSDIPKCLHEVAGAPMAAHVIRLARSVDSTRIAMVIGHGGEQLMAVAKTFDSDLEYFWQKEQRGTGHAVRAADAVLDDENTIAVILYGDTPLVQESTIRALIERAQQVQGPVVLGFDCPPPNRYGRLLTEGPSLVAIREAKEATEAELETRLCNSGVIAAPAEKLKRYLADITDDNVAGELYLTDIIEIAKRNGDDVGYIECDIRETLGVNTPADLRIANSEFQNLTRESNLADGVIMPAPDTVIFAYDTKIGGGTRIEPYCVFGNGVTVENNVTINAFSHLEGAHISESANIGPYARLRPGAEIGTEARVGNFVEVKNAVLEQGAKVNHLAYIGDATIGEKSNIGAGVITANYDGVFKHHTQIGSHAFVGSNSVLIAPVDIGARAMVASGSVVTMDVPEGDLALARARQVNKAGIGARLMSRLKAMKAAASKKPDAQ